MVDKNSTFISIRRQCALLAVSRSNMYYQPKQPDDESMLANEILEIWLAMPMYGYRKITKELGRRGYLVNHKKVLRIMQDMRIMAIYPKPKTTLINREHLKYPYLLKNLRIMGPNHAWAVDITYIKISTGFIYLIAIIDIHSRFILSWVISITMEAQACIDVFDLALQKWPSPEIINSDQGVQFTSSEWVGKVSDADIKISMDGVGRWADNIFIERFWRTIKHECVFLHSIRTVKEARKIIGDFIHIYNYKRLHQSLNYTTPAENYLK